MRKIFILFAIFILAGSVFASTSVEDIKKTGIAFYNTNDIQNALDTFNKIPDDKKDEEVWLLISNIYEDFKKPLDSINALNKSIKVNPKFYKAYYNLGNIYLDDRIYSKAIQFYKTSIKYEKKFPYSHYNLGCAYFQQGNYKQAKNSFLKAIVLDNSNPDFYYNLSLTYKMLKKPDKAKKYMDFCNSLQDKKGL